MCELIENLIREENAEITKKYRKAVKKAEKEKKERDAAMREREAAVRERAAAMKERDAAVKKAKENEISSFVTAAYDFGQSSLQAVSYLMTKLNCSEEEAEKWTRKYWPVPIA